MPKTKNSEAPEKEAPAFEDALSQLEELVREMESDQMPLEELIKNYEEGTRLFKVCEKRLDEAQGRIEIIRKNRNGTTPTSAAAPLKSKFLSVVWRNRVQQSEIAF